MSSEFIFEMKNITKSFGTNLVLDGVTIAVKPGEIRALMGENGAGKSTLMKILGGIYSSDKGEVYFNGVQTKISSVDDARKSGISFIHQEISNIASMTIAENLFLGREPRNSFGFVDFNKMHKDAKAALSVLDMHIDTHTNIEGMSIAQQQMLEVARAISEDAKVLIMDEPTASLSSKEVDNLFRQVERLKQKGVAIIYISHRMNETFLICDSVTVLRDGKFIGTKQTQETYEHELISMMVGRDFENLYASSVPEGKEIIMEVTNLNSLFVKDISFTLKKGEIFGISGLVGAGRTEMVRALFGIDSITSGQIIIDNKEVTIKSPSDAIKAGIALVPEERKTQGLFLMHDIASNLTFQVLSSFIHNFFIDTKKERQIINKFKSKLSIKMSSVNQLSNELSGGNQQKIVISKWLAASPKVLILDEPTRGIDVGAKAEIYRMMFDLANEGVSIIMISSDLPEIINNSSRIGIMNEGKLVKILDSKTDDISQENILYFAVGGETL